MLVSTRPRFIFLLLVVFFFFSLVLVIHADEEFHKSHGVLGPKPGNTR